VFRVADGVGTQFAGDSDGRSRTCGTRSQCDCVLRGSPSATSFELFSRMGGAGPAGAGPNVTVFCVGRRRRPALSRLVGWAEPDLREQVPIKRAARLALRGLAGGRGCSGCGDRTGQVGPTAFRHWWRQQCRHARCLPHKEQVREASQLQ